MISDPREIYGLLDSGILTRVNQPAQYAGGEPGSVRKDPDSVDVSIALCFPDTYSVGMSNLGYQILYHIVNGRTGSRAERAYAPCTDMQLEMREHDIPLFTVESFTPVAEFDLAGFTLQSELLYTNILMMLELAGIPLACADRPPECPLVIAGGPGALAPEPMAEFIDLFFIGDAEESLPEFLDLFGELKKNGVKRDRILIEAAAGVGGIYAPQLYRPGYDAGGKLVSIVPAVGGVPERIRARRIKNIDKAPFPTSPVVPLVETAHQRINLEIMRGCARGCRFCHAGMTNPHTRCRTPDTILKQAVESYWNTGYDEIALTSLSSSDYPCLHELLEKLTEYFTPLNVSISLPSLRVSDQIEQLVKPLNAVRRSGLTLAPEAATQRMRDVVKKDISDRDLFDGVSAAVRAGWKTIKLYFMVGLPGEKEEDIEAVGVLCNDLIGQTAKETKVRNIKLNVTVSPFVPKPHTPLQWEPMQPPDVLERKWEKIRPSGGRKLRYMWHDPAQSSVEAALARGDRRVSNMLLEAYKAGARFDAWGDMFEWRIWGKTLNSSGIHTQDGREHSHPCSPFRCRDADECLPWDHIDCGVSKKFLLRERSRALSGNR